MDSHPNRGQRYRIKGTFVTKSGKPFVRYWRNNNGCIGWIFPELKQDANIYTKSAGEKFLASSQRSSKGKYELEPVSEDWRDLVRQARIRLSHVMLRDNLSADAMSDAVQLLESALSAPPARDDVAALVEAQMEEEFRALQSVVYKIQMPENQNKFPTEYLNDAEKIAARKAVSQSLARVRDGGK